MPQFYCAKCKRPTHDVTKLALADLCIPFIVRCHGEETLYRMGMTASLVATVDGAEPTYEVFKPVEVMPRPAAREAAYAVLDGERAYQERVWGEKGERRTHAPEPGDGPNHTVGNFICFMEHYLFLARQELATKEGHGPALHQLRKVAALAVACFEQHGCPKREE